MKIQYQVLVLLLSFIVLGGLSCSSGDVDVRVDDVVIATKIGFNNEAENSVTEIAQTTRTIYLSARVVEPTAKTKVRVKWYRLPDDLIASEDFEGKGGSFDFDENKNSSFLVSQIEKEDLVWSLDEYRVDVQLNGKTVKSIFFKTVSDDEASLIFAGNVIKDIKISDVRRKSDLEIIDEKEKFSRYTNIIFIQVDVENANQDMSIKTNVRHLKSGIELGPLYSILLPNASIIRWELVRNVYEKLWPDRLWAEGTYEVTVSVDGIEARRQTFIIE